MVVSLARYLLSNNVNPSEITILAAYQGKTFYLKIKIKIKIKTIFIAGQVSLIRRGIRALREKEFKDNGDDFVNVISIDSYQGDENKYVIVSLVRSNREKLIGFLGEQNRRCVAQSRAKCGMYFIGDDRTLSSERSPWTGIIEQMRSQDLVSSSLPPVENTTLK